MSEQNPTYDELLATCQRLEKQVAQSLKIQDELVKIRNLRDQDVKRQELIKSYVSEALEAGSKKEFGIITLEYFVQVFNEAKGALLEVNANTKSARLISTFGMDAVDCEEFNLETLDLDSIGREVSFLSENRTVYDYFACFKLVEGYVGPFFGNDGQLAGLIFVGQAAEDIQFFPSFERSNFANFYAMTQFAGMLFQNLKNQKKLRYEIDERKAIESALTKSQGKLVEIKNQLEEKVISRTIELEQSNVKLQNEIHVKEQYENQLLRQTTELKRSNQELREFASAVSHDLKAPLRNISTFSDLLRINYLDQLDQSGREYMNIVTKAVRHMGEVIDGLLTLSNVAAQPTPQTPVDMNRVLDNVVERMAPTIKEQQATVMILNKNIPQINGNHTQMERLFQNLLENALKFTREGVDPVIKIDARREEGDLVFSVEDNGIGIADEYRDKIFGLFQRLYTDELYEGTGIGLSICKKIVEHMGGEMWVDSVLDEGTTFYIKLPISE